ncbi:hypothetical protein O6H91_09G106100 [Diphasiastrum complanatum]|uniref:Uncharacterized protein n=1 Tax=Diphasiastrum complanatum TaxID=34168 RepID=A0ACC2CTW6_DIPCM|nr:hypothetical protein O6H91_Y394200 [Diphasiastrum complanatum]KAJ7545072.1 hypothetical protein O6H91_09G106100 [Diphasiastrum complanatum]
MAAMAFEALNLIVAMNVMLFFTVFSGCTLAADEDPLQDFCVADLSSRLNVNGFACKDASSVKADDFAFTGFRTAANTANSATGFVPTPAFVPQLPALNTQGLSILRSDFAPDGLNPPHVHPRASELFFALQGRFEVGFVSSNNTLFSKKLEQGDVFIIPRGLVHFQHNIGGTAGVGLAVFNSQNSGVERLQNTLFGSGIPDAVLQKTFQLDEAIIDQLKKTFTP